MYHVETCSVLGEQKSCTHLLTENVRHKLLPHRADGKQYLLESCTGCRVIRAHKIPINSAPISYEQITPKLMCKGPQDTVLVLDETNKSITQLFFFAGKIQCYRGLFFNRMHASEMWYSDKHGHLIIMDDEFATTGLKLETGEVIWQHRKCERPYSASPFTIPDERICSISSEKLTVVDLKDGTVNRIPVVGVSPSRWRICFREDRGDRVVAMAEFGPNNARISCCEIQIQDILRRNVVPLRDIISDQPEDNSD